MEIAELITILHREKCSCVIYNGGQVSMCHQRGIKDLYELLTENPDQLKGALVADKVIGKGAAAILAVGGVNMVYADVISIPAIDLFKTNYIPIEYGLCVSNIINRKETGICPVEKICEDCETAPECIPLIEKFVSESNKVQ